MDDVAAGLREVARRVRADGFPTEEMPGFATRGKGLLTPRCAVEHWTGGPRTGNAPSLRVVTYGRPGLENALCNTYSSREPRLYLVAAGTAWHAGRGSWRGVTGNSNALGHEAENSGGGEWTPRHLALIDSLERAQIDVFGFGVDMLCDHFEWAEGRKIDCKDVGGAKRRARVAALAGHRPIEEDEDMIQFDEKSDRVRRLQRQLSMYLYYTGGFDGGGTRYADLPPERNPHNRTEGSYLRTDGHYGTVTASAMWHAARRWEINRRVGGAATLFPFDHRNPDLDVISVIIAHLDAFLAENKV